MRALTCIFLGIIVVSISIIWGNGPLCRKGLSDLINSLFIFIDIPSLLVCFCFPILGLFARFSFKEILNFSSDVRDVDVNSALLGGGICHLIWLIQMLQDMSDPSAIGPAMAIGLLPGLYSLFICMFFVFGKTEKKTLNKTNIASIITILPSMFLVSLFIQLVSQLLARN